MNQIKNMFWIFSNLKHQKKGQWMFWIGMVVLAIFIVVAILLIRKYYLGYPTLPSFKNP